MLIISIGMVSGTIVKNSNISNITVTGKNSWNLTYNESTGVFNILKAAGAKTEEIMDITYTTTSAEGTATIKISDINMVTIGYEEVSQTELSKNIEVKEKLNVSITGYEKVVEGTTNYLEGINPETTIQTLLGKTTTNVPVEIYKGTTKITDTTAKIGTGMTIRISLNGEKIEYQAVVKGDLSGDGIMGDVDALMLARYKVGLDTSLTGAYLKATDINNNGTEADDIDLLMMVRKLAGLDV